MSCQIFPIPPEYRFRPTKKELLCDHLEKKNQCKDSQSMSIIPVIDLCKHEPRELPGLAFTGQENLGRKLFFFFFFWFTRAESWDSQGKWYFFAPRDYKYPNSSTRSNRTTGEGSWKPTGNVQDIKAPGSEAVIGRKRILTFQKRGVPKSHKSSWVIHEYYHIQPHSDPPKQIGDFVVCCLKYKSDNSDHDEDAPFCNRGSGSCSMVSDVANQLVEENLASNEQFNGTDDEAETGGGTITEAEEYLAYKKLRDELGIPIGNQNEFQGSQTDPCNLWTSVEGQADRSNSSHHMNEEQLDDPENMDSFFRTPAPPQLHQLQQSPMNTTNVHNDECCKRKYPFEDNDSSLNKKNNISSNDGDELVSNTTSNSENQAADVILEGDSVICRLKNKSDKKDSLVSDEGEPDSTGVSNWKIQAALKNDEALFHQPQPLDYCCSSAVWTSLELEAVLQAIGTNDDCNKLQSTCGDNTSCLEDKNEVSTCDEDENMDGVFPQLCDPPEVNQDSLLRPLQPQDYCPSIPQSPIYTKLGNVSDANLCFSECDDWQSAFKKKNSTNEVDIPVRHIMSNFQHQSIDSRILEVHHQTRENMESAFYPFQPQDSALQSMMYTIHGDDLHNIECNELQSYSSDQTYRSHWEGSTIGIVE